MSLAFLLYRHLKLLQLLLQRTDGFLRDQRSNSNKKPTLPLCSTTPAAAAAAATAAAAAAAAASHLFRWESSVEGLGLLLRQQHPLSKVPADGAAVLFLSQQLLLLLLVFLLQLLQLLLQLLPPLQQLLLRLFVRPQLLPCGDARLRRRTHKTLNPKP